jgi:hypothetical protein
MIHYTNTNNPIDFPTMTHSYEKINEAHKAMVAKFEQERIDLLKEAERNGVKVVHVFYPEQPKGGLTIAFRKSMPNQVSTNMVECAVVTCSFADNFNRKIGTTLALQQWFNGFTVALPLSSGFVDEDLSGRVKRAFMALYDSGSTV